MPIGSSLVTQAEIQGQVPSKLEVILNVIGLGPTEKMHMGVAGGDFRIVADAEKHGSERKTAGNRAAYGIGHRTSCERRIGERGAGEIVRKQIQVFVTEIPAGF